MKQLTIQTECENNSRLAVQRVWNFSDDQIHQMGNDLSSMVCETLPEWTGGSYEFIGWTDVAMQTFLVSESRSSRPTTRKPRKFIATRNNPDAPFKLTPIK
jgi:hypothetical protein